MNPQPVKKLPRIPITNPEFKYTPSYETDVRKLFDEERKKISNKLEREVKNVGDL